MKTGHDQNEQRRRRQNPGFFPNPLVVTLGVLSLVSSADGFTDAVISGNGNLVYAVTGSDRLVRADVTSDAITELSAAVPRIQIVSGALVPGARIDLSVSAAPASAPDPAIMSDAGAAPVFRGKNHLTNQGFWTAGARNRIKMLGV